MKTTKTMKKYFALLGAVSVLSSTSVFADITLNNPVIGGADGGGAFTATDSGQFGTFLTFCLEKNEHITLPGTYSYTINSGAVKGGLGTGPDGIPGAFDPLSIGTAYLYSQFVQGGLGAVTPTLGNAMQNAIWWLENEISTADLTAGGLALINYASLQTGYSTNALTYAANGAYGVVALNLYASDGLHQDMLAIVPEPSTVIAGALLLLPLGISALRIVRKNRTA